MGFATKKILACIAASVVAGFAACAETETSGDPEWYAGAAGGILLPGNGNSLRRAATVSAHAGRYVTDVFALEVSGACAPNVASDGQGTATLTSAAVRGLFHLTGFEEFDLLFGCERFDPFVTFGAMAALASRHVFADDSHRTGLGPTLGMGAFYHLTDNWSIRLDATAAMTVDSPCGMLYGIGIGLQRSFGGGGQ